MKLPFTDKALKALVPPTDQPQAYYWDEKTSGLQYVLGRGGTGSFVAVYHRDGRKIRETLGRYGTGPGELSLPDARKAFSTVLGRVSEGKLTPGDARRFAKTGPTVQEAAGEYLRDMQKRGCRPSSIDTVRREIEDKDRSYVKAWLDRPLRSVSPREAVALHDHISLHNGKHVANRVVRNLSTIWSCIAKVQLIEDQTWPANPFQVVTPNSGDQEGFQERRREPIPWSQMPAWKEAVEKLSPVRRDYNLLVLLTGMRRTDACTIRREHINLTDAPIESRVWHLGKKEFQTVTIPARSMLRPYPKGGAKKAFVVPLSDELVKIIERRLKENLLLGREDNGWLFPARATFSKKCHACAELGLGEHQAKTISHLSEPKEVAEILVSPHRLRDTYITATEEAGVTEGAAKVLVNHAWGKQSVTAGYRKQDLEFLRGEQQKVTDFLVGKMTKV